LAERRALFLSPEAPYPAIGGGAMRSASLLEYLKQRYAVDVILFRQPGANAPECPGAHRLLVIDLPAHRKDLPSKAARNLSRLLRGVAPLVDRFSGFENQVADFIKDHSYAAGIIEHFWCAAYHDVIAQRCATTVLDLHNVESDWHVRCAVCEPWPLRQTLKRFGATTLAAEKRLLPRFSMLLATSDDDAARLCAIAPGAKTLVYPNTIPSAPEPEHTEEDAIAFAGNLEYLPNVQAVRFLLGEIWPELRKRHPELQLKLIGKNSHAIARYVPAGSGIQLTGAVDDAVAELAKCKIGVAPVLSGSGTRLKILEMWAAGIPVVSTRIGAEGLGAVDRCHLSLADRPGEFVASVSELLASASLRREIGQAGRARYLEFFTWESGWKRLDANGI
jgi:glycosyltransferase involved in cell wall biosynthesis